MKTREKIFAVGLLMLFASLNINAQEVEKRICSDKYSVTIEEAMVQDGAVILDMGRSRWKDSCSVCGGQRLADGWRACGMQVRHHAGGAREV